jgi:two-component system OmpR family response regulator
MDEGDRILVVDDDPEIRRLLRDYLEANGYRAGAVGDGRQMRRALGAARYDLLVLDLMLPGEDGLVLCRDLRASGEDIPIIMLTARGEEADRILGLEMGADDYLPKPFAPRELLARIRVVLRRARAVPPRERRVEARRMEFADWILDLPARELHSPEGVTVPLSGGEFELLVVFLTHPNRTLSRDRLMDLTRGREHYPLDRSIDVQVSRLRRRLRDDGHDPRIIRTVRGAGYALAADVRQLG